LDRGCENLSPKVKWVRLVKLSNELVRGWLK
jgi:hypothetical protein